MFHVQPAALWSVSLEFCPLQTTFLKHNTRSRWLPSPKTNTWPTSLNRYLSGTLPESDIALILPTLASASRFLSGAWSLDQEHIDEAPPPPPHTHTFPLSPTLTHARTPPHTHLPNTHAHTYLPNTHVLLWVVQTNVHLIIGWNFRSCFYRIIRTPGCCFFSMLIQMFCSFEPRFWIDNQRKLQQIILCIHCGMTWESVCCMLWEKKSIIVTDFIEIIFGQ